MKRPAVVGLVLLLLASSARAAAPLLKEEETTADRAFLVQMTEVGRMQLALAREALGRAGSGRMRELAGRIVTDRGRFERELLDAATARGIDVPSGMTPYQLITAQWIGHTSGKAFDLEYLRLVGLALSNTTDRLRIEARDGGDPALRSLARAELAALQPDLMMAKEVLEEAVGGTAA